MKGGIDCGDYMYFILACASEKELETEIKILKETSVKQLIHSK